MGLVRGCLLGQGLVIFLLTCCVARVIPVFLLLLSTSCKLLFLVPSLIYLRDVKGNVVVCN